MAFNCASGNVTDKYGCDAYGAVLSHDRRTGSKDQPYQYVGQLGYYTHYQIPGVGLMQLGVRFYNPGSGAFTQGDKAGQERQGRYTYADGSPCTLVDPAGLTPFDVCKKKLTNKLPNQVKKAIEECVRDHLGNEEALKKCLKGIKDGVGLDLACDLFACLKHNEDHNSEGPRPYRGFPCDDPRAKTDSAYCLGCAEWNFNKCSCKTSKNPLGLNPGLADCQIQHRNDAIECNKLCR